MVREPIVAGQFYAEREDACMDQLHACLPDEDPLGDEEHVVYGGIVPHAGWRCSGTVTGKVMRALSSRAKPQSVVLVGAVHRVRANRALVYPGGQWKTPLGKIDIDEQLAKEVLHAGPEFESNPQAHEEEHSLEVQIPFVQSVFQHTPILPIMVPPVREAAHIGQLLGEVLSEVCSSVLVIGTTDLTHYGPSYGFTEHGAGQDGLDWARTTNDQRMLDLISNLDVQKIVPEATTRRNACGPGAVTATLAACITLGADRAVLLEHTTSQETLKDILPGPTTDAVGYAGYVITKLDEGS